MFYTKNRAALGTENRHQALLASLKGCEISTNVQCPPTQKEDICQSQEAQTLIQSQCHPDLDGVHVLMGFGFGHLLKAAFEHSPGTLIVYEPNVAFIRFVLEQVDLASYLAAERVHIVTSLQELFQRTYDYHVYEKPLDLLVLNGQETLFKSELKQIESQIREIQIIKEMNEKTLRDQHIHWIESFFGNVPYLPETQPFDALAGQFNQKQTLLISNGPSLDEAIPQIKSLADNMIIIAAAGALRPLWKAGIIPDFVVFLDRIGMQEHLAGIPFEVTQEIRFLVTPATQQCCFQVPAKQRYLILTENTAHFSHWLNETWSTSHLNLSDGGSISIIGLQAAMAMGCNPILLVGQDLSLRGNQVYADQIMGHLDEQAGYFTLPSSEKIYGREVPLSQVKGQNGETLRTTIDYRSFLWHLEKIARDNRDVAEPKRLINASTGGAWIEGFEHMSLQAYQKSAQPVVLHKERLMSAQTSHLDLSFKEKSLRLQAGLSHLIQGLRGGIQYTQVLQQKAETLLHTHPEQWTGVLSSFLETRTLFFNLLREYPFISACTGLASMDYIRHYQWDAETYEALYRNFQIDLSYFKNCHATLHTKALPWVLTAEKELKKDIPLLSPNPLLKLEKPDTVHYKLHDGEGLHSCIMKKTWPH